VPPDIKHLGLNITELVENLYVKSYKIQEEEIKKDVDN
jgi:hypothetical protein